MTFSRMWACLLLVSSCAGDGDPDPGDGAGDSGPIWAPCEPRPDSGSVTHVDLQIDSPVPVELSAGCAHGTIGDLVAYLSIATEDTCWLEVSASGVSGCCARVTADQSTWAYLYYRSEAHSAPIAVQSKFVELPTTSPPVLELTFVGIPADDDWDTDGDTVGNLDEWCAGTL